jgi:outer membrane protein
VLSASAVFAQAPLKIGYVDSEVILQQYPESIKAQGELEAIVKTWRAQIDSLQQDLQQDYADYQKKASMMKETQKAEAQQRLVQKQQAAEEFNKQKFDRQTGEIVQKQDQIMKPVKDKIFTAIERVAQEESMSFVFDKTGEILLLYADSAFDVTFKVLDKLKRGK